MTDSRDFYQQLPTLTAFPEALQAELHQPLPADWWVLVADVVDSTRAIEAGHYKAVNTIGVACIAALLNIDRKLALPYAFGGDGATFALPPAILPAAESALRGTVKLARESFGLKLRVGLVPVAALQAQGFWLKLAKVRLSEAVTQACFSGRGWEEAERQVKAAGVGNVRRIEEGAGLPADADFSGFECRWRSVDSFNGHKLALLVTALDHQAEARQQTYQAVLDAIHRIYGDEQQHHPLRPGQLQLTLNPMALEPEWQVRTHQQNPLARLRYFCGLIIKAVAGRWLFWRAGLGSNSHWGRYRAELVDNSDFRKFDGVLRMVIDGNDQQYEALSRTLAEMHAQGHLAYGLHQSPQALLTCLVHSYTGEHVHFVDGSNGGYAMAARGLKQQLASLANQSRRS